MATSTPVVNIAPPSANGRGPANPVQGELKLVEELLRSVAQVKYNFLADILDAIVTAGGKRLRPSLLLPPSNCCTPPRWFMMIQLTTRCCGAASRR